MNIDLGDDKGREVIKSFVLQLANSSHESPSGTNIESVIGMLVRLCSNEACVTELTQQRGALKALLHHLAAGITKDSLKENMLKILDECTKVEDGATIFAQLEGQKSVASAIESSNKQKTSARSRIHLLGMTVLQSVSQHSKCRFPMAQPEAR